MNAGLAQIRGKPMRTRAAFTFVEVVVAMALLGLALAGIYSVITMSMQTRQHAHDYYVATIIAGNQIERAKTFLFDELHDLEEHERVVDERGIPTPSGRFLRTTEVENVAGNEWLRKVSVEVGVPHRLRGTPGGGLVLLSTYISRIE